MRDDVKIVLAGQELLNTTSYEIKLGIFEQPGSFTCTIGRPYEFRLLAERFPPKTTYQIFLDETLIQSGLTDAFSRAGGATKTEIQLRGRDPLQKLVDTQLDKELTFSEATYHQLTETAIDKSGLGKMLERFGLDGLTVIANNEANRKAITGSQKAASLSTDDLEFIETEVGPGSKAGSKRSKHTLLGESGETWWAFLIKQYRRVGLFLWAAADSTVILSSPSTDQPALYRLVRTPTLKNIEDDSFSHDTTQRHSECIVYGAALGGKEGASAAEGRFIDDEMVALLNPLEADRANGGTVKLIKTLRDKEVKSNAHAMNLARREIAEERRNAWKLSYTIGGHHLSELGGDKLIAPMPDTIVDVEDDDLGVYGPMYIEGVTFIGEPGATRTKIDVLRVEDVFFRNEVPSTAKVPKKLRETGVNTITLAGPVLVYGIGLTQNLMTDAPGLKDESWKHPISNDPFANPVFGRAPTNASESVNSQKNQVFTSTRKR